MIPLNQKSNEFEGLKHEFRLFYNQSHTHQLTTLGISYPGYFSKGEKMERKEFSVTSFSPPLQLYVTPGKETERYINFV